MLDIGREDAREKTSRHCRKKSRARQKNATDGVFLGAEYDQQQLNELQEQKRQKDLLDAKAQAKRNYQRKRRNVGTSRTPR